MFKYYRYYFLKIRRFLGFDPDEGSGISIPHFNLVISPRAAWLLNDASWDSLTIVVDENITPSKPSGEYIGWRNKKVTPSSERAA